MRKWICTICGFVYDEAEGMPEEGIKPGTAWEDIPDDWVCPDCGAPKEDFLWEEYCGAWAHFVAGEREGGGTIWPVIYAGEAEANVQNRLDEIRSYRRLSDGWK